MRVSHFVAGLIGLVLTHLWFWSSEMQFSTWQSRWFGVLFGAAVFMGVWELVIRLSPALYRALAGKRRD